MVCNCQGSTQGHLGCCHASLTGVDNILAACAPELFFALQPLQGRLLPDSAWRPAATCYREDGGKDPKEHLAENHALLGWVMG